MFFKYAHTYSVLNQAFCRINVNEGDSGGTGAKNGEARVGQYNLVVRADSGCQ
jgi:hypothetical protein